MIGDCHVTKEVYFSWSSSIFSVYSFILGNEKEQSFLVRYLDRESCTIYPVLVINVSIICLFLFGPNFSFFRNLYNHQADELVSLLSIIEGVSLRHKAIDKRVWIIHSSGLFSCKHSFDNIFCGVFFRTISILNV